MRNSSPITYIEKPLMVRSSGKRSRRRGVGPSRGSAVIVVLALAAVNYFLFFTNGEGASTPTIDQRLDNGAVAPDGGQGKRDGVAPREATPGGSPELTPSPDEVDDFGEPVGRKISGSLKRGSTILRALRDEGIDNRAAMPLIRAMEGVFDFRRAQVGNTFEAFIDDEGQVRRFTYTLSPLDVYEVALERDGSYAARKVAIPTRVEIAKVGCAINRSLYGSMARCGEGPQLGAIFIDLFAWDLDFFQDVRKGDEFKVIVEKISVDGRFLKYGEILAAEYQGKFGNRRIVHYRDPEGHEGYYTPEGRAVRKELLKSPLKYTRVSAGKGGGIRTNLKKSAPVVYEASAGTPVWAVASGTVVFAGESGSLGTTVTIRHDNGLTSTYGHLGRLGRSIKVGKLVNQKHVIGYVGQSGRASEPQLLFSLRRNGKLVNPLRVNATEADPIPTEDRAHFEREIHDLLEDLEATPVIGISERRS